MSERQLTGAQFAHKALLARIAALEAENAHLSSLCDRLTAVNQSRVNDEAVALKRAEQAEAELAVWERRAQNAGFKALEMATAADKAEAALAAASTRINDLLAERTELMLDLAQRDRMLELAFDQYKEEIGISRDDWTSESSRRGSMDDWLADLRTRAEEGSA